MPQPQVEMIALRPAVKTDDATTLDVLVRITPPMPEVHFVRPPLNIGLVLDRSGSMAGAKKMAYAREAASYAVQELLPTDRVSVTIFDNVVETIVPNAPAADKPGIVKRIAGIQPRNATALHAGWKEGGNQVETNLIFAGLNRVILLSDGLANEGMTDPNAIATEVKGLSARGVSTTTMGLGDDYNEDLMQAMGEAGDGNYYYIETPLQLADIFHTELKGLMATAGNKVSLGLEPQAGAVVVEVLNDLDRNVFGRLVLPNLVIGMPISIVVRLKIPATAGMAEVCNFRLAWDDPKGAGRQSLYASLTLPAVPSSAWDALAVDPVVSEQVAIQMAARAKKEAVVAFDQGDLAQSRGFLNRALSCMQAEPSSPEVRREMEEIAKIRANLEAGQHAQFRKEAREQAYRRKRGTE